MARLKKKSLDQRNREHKIHQRRKREAAVSLANSNAVQNGKSITIKVKTDNDSSKKQESECEDGEDIMEDCSKICTPLDVGDKDQNLQKKKPRMKIESLDYSPRGNKVRERAREEYAEVYAKEREEFEENAAKVAAEIKAQIAERYARKAPRRGVKPRLKKTSFVQRKRENKILRDRKREAALSSANSNAVQKGKSITIKVKTDNDSSKKQESECEDGEDIMEDCSKICTPLDVGDKDQNLRREMPRLKKRSLDQRRREDKIPKEKRPRRKIESPDLDYIPPRGNKVRKRAREEYTEVYAKEREEFEEYAAKVAAETKAQIAERYARKTENAAIVASLKDTNTPQAPQREKKPQMSKKNLVKWRKQQKILEMEKIAEKIANDALQAEKMERQKKYYLTKWRKEQEIHKIAKISPNDAVQAASRIHLWSMCATRCE